MIYDLWYLVGETVQSVREDKNTKNTRLLLTFYKKMDGHFLRRICVDVTLVCRLVRRDDLVEDEDPGVHVDVDIDAAVRHKHLHWHSYTETPGDAPDLTSWQP